MRYLLYLSLLAASAFSFASPSSCTGLKTQSEISSCMTENAGSGEKALTRAVSAYSATLSPSDKALFKKAQAAWKSYADATCNFSSAPLAGGSMQGADAAQCMSFLAEQRRLMLVHLANCENTSQRTDCLTQFRPGLPANTGMTSSTSKASVDDVDRLTTYGAALGKGIACKADGVDEASRRVGKWMDEHFQPGSDDHKAYLVALTQGIEATARMQAEKPVESCDSVRKSFASFPWP